MEFNNDMSGYDDSKRRKILLIIFIISILTIAVFVINFLLYRNEKINEAKDKNKNSGFLTEEQKKIQEEIDELNEIRKKTEESQGVSSGTENAMESIPVAPEVSNKQVQELDSLRNETDSSASVQDTQEQLNQLDQLRNK
jgi:Tfp pilus assembly protein PilN